MRHQRRTPWRVEAGNSLLEPLTTTVVPATYGVKKLENTQICQHCTYRLVELPGIHHPSEGGRNSLHADLVEGEAHDAVELAHDERQPEAFGVFHLRINPGMVQDKIRYMANYRLKRGRVEVTGSSRVWSWRLSEHRAWIILCEHICQTPPPALRNDLNHSRHFSDVKKHNTSNIDRGGRFHRYLSDRCIVSSGQVGYNRYNSRMDMKIILDETLHTGEALGNPREPPPPTITITTAVPHGRRNAQGSRTHLGESLFREFQAPPGDGVDRQVPAHGAASVRDLKVPTVLRYVFWAEMFWAEMFGQKC